MPNNTPKQPTHKEWNEKLYKILNAHFEHGAFNPATNGEKFKSYQNLYGDEAAKAINDLVLELVVGEDYEPELYDVKTKEYRSDKQLERNRTGAWQNLLRRQQREIITGKPNQL